MFRRRPWLLLFLVICSPSLYAEQRKYVIGTTVDLTGGATNLLGSTGIRSNQNQPLFPFYGAFPSITMTSTGAHSLLSASYSYGFNRSKSEQNLKLDSHAASLNFTTPLTQELGISFSESFQATSDAATFNALRGVTANPISPFIFYPVAAQLMSRTNTSNVTVNYKLSDRSGLGFTVSHSLLRYDAGATAFSSLSNQQNISGGVTYNWQTDRRETWTLGYKSGSLSFKSFDSSYSDTAYVGYSNVIGSAIKFNLTAGLTRIKNQRTGDGYIGYNSSALLEKTLKTNAFSLFYTQTSGQTSGLGSLSDTRVAGLSWNHVTRTLTEFVDISVFDTQGILANPYSQRGISAAASIGIPLSRKWSLQGGAHYQKYDDASAFGFRQKRLFIALRYTDPALLGFLR